MGNGVHSSLKVWVIQPKLGLFVCLFVWGFFFFEFFIFTAKKQNVLAQKWIFIAIENSWIMFILYFSMEAFGWVFRCFYS